MKHVILAAVCGVSALCGASDEPQIPETSAEPMFERRIIELAPSGGVADPSIDLRTAYVLLRQLDADQLDEQPRALTERAIDLYRDGVKAYQIGETVEARRLGAASRELAHALELARFARSGGADHPELPPPPPLRFSIRAVPETPADGQIVEVTEFPPVLNGVVVETVQDGENPSSDPKSGTVRAEVKIVGADETSKPVQVFAKEGVVELVQGDDKEKRAFVVKVPKDQIRGRVFVRSEGPLKALALPARVRLGAKQPLTQELVFALRQDERAQARTELQAAHDLIKKARKEEMNDASKLYLDAARDLYNAARREAQAGRHARAIELSQAAVAVARVPALLAGKETGGQDRVIEIRGDAKGAEGGEESGKPGQVRVEVRAEAKSDPAETKEGESPKLRLEIRKRIVDADGKVHEEVEVKEGDEARKLLEGGEIKAKFLLKDKRLGEEKDEKEGDVLELKLDDAGPVVGVGIALEAADGDFVVRELVPDGPAAKDGTIQAGDRLIGIETEGEVETFEGKPLVDVVRRIRGPENSTIRLVIRPQDAEETKTVELKRVRIVVPDQEQEIEIKDEESKDRQTFLFKGPEGSRVIELAPRGTLREVRPGTIHFRVKPRGADGSPKPDPRPAKPAEKPELPPSIDV